MAGWDWASTPIGGPEAWPASLRSVVRILLTSRFSMWMGWGQELTFFYNDTYQRDTLRAKHPWALGRPASEVWAEIWHDIGPRIDSVLHSGIATWDEGLLLFLERSGYPEETYHTFSYSPLGDENGKIMGILCVVTEDTDRVLSERRMATLCELASAVAATRTKGDVIAAVQRQLSCNREDLPFTLSYLCDEDGTARLACTTGIEQGTPAAPDVIELDDQDGLWPVSQVGHGHTVVIDDLADRFPQLPVGAWTQPPTKAAAVALPAAPGQGSATGFIVVGLNPYRPFDDRYRGFIELLANQIASGLVNAGIYEAERRRAEALAELDRAKTDFFSNVSHELRTPLTLIMGPVEELRAAPQLDEARVRAELEVVRRNGLRLGKLVNTLLEFSRLQADRVQARFEPVDLAAFTAELASVFRSAVEQAGLDYVVDCPSLPEPVFVDRDMWEMVVLNLLSNALKFTFGGTITVTVRRTDGCAVLTVADTGTGIPTRELPRLFERFHRVERARARSGEGSGIGLAMVRELLSLHGGTVTADSAEGRGTVFTVTVPLGHAHLPTDQVMTLSPAGTAAGVMVSAAAEPFVTEALRWLPGTDEGPEQRPGVPTVGSVDPLGAFGRVLVADDNADMREYLHRLLSPRYDVEVVGDGKTALAAALAEPPELVLCDVMMPGLDGRELLAALRGDSRTARVPVLLLSARAGQEAAVEGLAAGADDYLVKPFAAQELMARVGAHVQLGRVRREAEQRFTAMADLAPTLIWVADPNGARTFLNAGWYRFTGRDCTAELGEGWREGLHPQDRQRYVEMVAAATAARQPWEIEYRLRRADGSYHWLLEHAVPVGTGDGFAGHVGSCTDINARYRETERQTLLAQVGAALDDAALEGEAGVEQRCGRLARLMVEMRLADLCTVRRVDDDGRLVPCGVAAIDPEAQAALVGVGETPWGRQIVATRRVMLVNDTVMDWPGEAGLTDSERAEPARRVAVHSGFGVPLTARGRVLGVLGLGRRADSPPFTADDQKLVEEVAARAGLALDNAVLLAEERATAARLAVLQQATAELSAAITPGQVASAVRAHVGELLHPRQIAVFELDVAAQTLTALALTDTDTDAKSQWATVGLHTSVPVAAAVRAQQAVWLEDVSELHDDPAMAEVMTGRGLGAVYALPLVAGGQPVGALGVGFTQPRRLSPDERAALLALAEQCAQALDRARLYRTEHRIAETLQRSLLPQQLPQLQRLALAARYLPGAEGVQAGGDWYDVIELDSHRIAITVGDVVGQGPAAAAVMGQLRTVLTGALWQGRTPAAALELLDEFAAWIPGARASTAACLILDWSTGHVCWARAGHPPPLLVVNGEPRYLDGQGHGPVLGVAGRPPFTEGVAVIGAGATLILYTDGLVERRGEVVDEGLARLATAATRHATATPNALLDHLVQDMVEQGTYSDDVAVIAARLLPATLSQRLPARPVELSAVRRAVRAWAATAGLSEEWTEDLQLALGEAAANAVEHAYCGQTPGEFDYSITRATDGTLEVQVQDFGIWRPEPADNHHRGRGLGLIRTLADDVVVDTTAHGTTVRFRMTTRR
jgi:PAS domain S-box-containing protein